MFIKERNNTWNTPYLSNAKELDEETGMYYYGARYYEPRLSLWMSTDPLQEKYINVSTYCYVLNNPVKLIDPNGKIPIETIWDIGNVIYDLGAAVINHIKGNHKAALSNWGDLGLDAAAVLIPYVPAGVSKALKVADKTVDVLKGFKPLAKVSAGGKTSQKWRTFTKVLENLLRVKELPSIKRWEKMWLRIINGRGM